MSVQSYKIRIDDAHGTIHPDHMAQFPEADAVLSTNIKCYDTDIKLDAPIYLSDGKVLGKHYFFDTK